MRHVGDGDPHTWSAVWSVLDAERVVEVARGLGIDRAELAVAQIDAIAEVAIGELLRRGDGLRDRFVGKLEWNDRAREDLLDLGARILGIAEHLEQLAGELAARGIGIPRDLDDDGIAVFALWRIVDADAAVVRGDARIIGLEVHGATDAAQDAGEARATTGEHFGDSTFGAA